MSFNNGIKQVKKLIEKKQENKIWDMWLSLYPVMVTPCMETKGQQPLLKYKSFQQFLREIKNPIPKENNTQDIEEQAEIIKRKHQKLTK